MFLAGSCESQWCTVSIASNRNGQQQIKQKRMTTISLAIDLVAMTKVKQMPLLLHHRLLKGT